MHRPSVVGLMLIASLVLSACNNDSAPMPKGQPMKQQRQSYEESIRRLRELGLVGRDENPGIPDHTPQPEDDNPLGLSFFRTVISDEAAFSNLSIPRTFFGRSEIKRASFQNCDLTESNLRWNDFVEVDFTGASLARADLRASIYTRVKFIRTDLRGADLRRSDFDSCRFDDALMDGAVITRKQGTRLNLSGAQKSVVDWRAEDGPEPSGG